MLNLRCVSPCSASRLAGWCGLLTAFVLSPTAPSRADSPPSTTYSVHHSLTIKEIPAGTRKVRVWFWLPQEDEYQRVLDLVVTQAPAGYRITQAADGGHTCLYAEVENPTADSISLATDFIARRTAATVPLDPDRAGELTDRHRETFAEYLRRDVPFMQVDDRMQKLADEICGHETNVIREARLLYNYVVEKTQHYSRGPSAPKSSNRGDAAYCLAQGGGACTDMHALFMALARARGIPTRIYFGSRLVPANEGKEMDPGYRCWVTFFAPNYGWVPCDLAAGNTIPEKKEFYFGGLDERRLLFSAGRDLDMAPKQDGPRVNLFIRAYVEVDGKPYTTFDRILKYTELKQTASLAGAAARPVGR